MRILRLTLRAGFSLGLVRGNGGEEDLGGWGFMGIVRGKRNVRLKGGFPHCEGLFRGRRWVFGFVFLEGGFLVGSLFGMLHLLIMIFLMMG